MTTNRLGNSDLELTPIGLGAWAIGGPGYAFGWGAQDDQDSINSINVALDAGMNWIDTAAVYGLGHSEKMVAEALVGRTDRPLIFTKCGRVWDESGQVGKCLTADSVRKECEDSLRRLKVDVIDLYQMHWPEPDDQVEAGWGEMAKLQREGKVRWIGVSNFSVSQMKRAQTIAPITSLQPPYSLIRREVEPEILPYCFEQGIGVINYAPMGSGLLTGSMNRERLSTLPDDDWRKKGVQFTEPNVTRNLMIAEMLKEIAAVHGRTAGEAAIAWTLHNPAITAAIVGIRQPSQVRGVIGAMDFRLTRAEIMAIESV